MQVMEIQHGQLALVKRPHPILATDEVLIKVAAAGINRADLFQVQGNYPPPEGASDLPGLEVSGTIVATGANVSGWKEGDMVCALLAGGGYAEYVTVSSSLVLPIPKNLNFIQAASLPEACFTVWMNLFMKGKLQAGETILIHAGASGIGTMAIQCAHAYGATVIVTAGSAEKCNSCIALGADRAIHYPTEDFAKRVQQITEGRGVDIVLDSIGGEYIQRNLRCLSVGGRMISIAFLQGANATVNFAPLLLRNITWMGTTLRSQPLEKKAAIARDIHAHLWPLIEKGAIHPVVDRVFPFHEANAAHHYMQSNQNIGKIVLDMQA